MQVGDYVDTLLLPSSGMQNATVRWVPGPGEIVGGFLAPHHLASCGNTFEDSASLQKAYLALCAAMPCLHWHSRRNRAKRNRAGSIRLTQYG